MLLYAFSYSLFQRKLLRFLLNFRALESLKKKMNRHGDAAATVRVWKASGEELAAIPAARVFSASRV